MESVLVFAMQSNVGLRPRGLPKRSGVPALPIGRLARTRPIQSHYLRPSRSSKLRIPLRLAPHPPASRPVTRTPQRSEYHTVTPELRQRAEEVLGYTFKNPNLLKEALTHASIADNRLDSNERMEFLGDAVLDLIVCEALYQQVPAVPGGRPDQDQVGRRLPPHLRGGGQRDRADRPADHRQGHQLAQQMPSSLAAAVYESIVAAVYLDGGFEVVKDYVLRTMTPKIEEIAANAHQQNFKAVLQQHAQKILGATPMYELLDEKGPDHSKCFEVCVCIDGRRFTSAWGPNKKMAEQKAAAAGAGGPGRARSRRKWTRRSKRGSAEE